MIATCDCHVCSSRRASAASGIGDRLRVKDGLATAGKAGIRIGNDVFLYDIWWTPLLWDHETAPRWMATENLEPAPAGRVA